MLLYGHDPQDGVAGFGRTLAEACLDFDLNWFTHAGPLANLGSDIVLPDDELPTENPMEFRPDEDPADWWKRDAEG